MNILALSCIIVRASSEGAGETADTHAGLGLGCLATSIKISAYAGLFSPRLQTFIHVLLINRYVQYRPLAGYSLPHPGGIS